MSSLQTTLLIAGNYLFNIMTGLIVVNALLSWFHPNPDNPVIKLIYGLTEPLMAPFRRFTSVGAFDFSGIAAILVIEFVMYPLYTFIIKLIF